MCALTIFLPWFLCVSHFFASCLLKRKEETSTHIPLPQCFAQAHGSHSPMNQTFLKQYFYVPQADMELIIHLLLPPTCWPYRQARISIWGFLTSKWGRFNTWLFWNLGATIAAMKKAEHVVFSVLPSSACSLAILEHRLLLKRWMPTWLRQPWVTAPQDGYCWPPDLLAFDFLNSIALAPHCLTKGQLLFIL